ncbi:AraC-like ligand-binding domain-containing protein [Falsiroseomonas oryzae]|uniref:AraC-like ligand-binding domain-containing protein n=1 Tax=Falsiroseomonas oryzae TaxID=2766473 RepID=UPI0022EA566C|nr:helix-turn-helix domain-containing protein [Roseomonas sp. MO-31]
MWPLRETTRHLRPAEQFDFWHGCNDNLVEYDLRATAPESGFAAEAATWRFGGFALMTATTPAARYRRTPAQLRRDGLDHWTLSIPLRGHRVVRIGDSTVVAAPGHMSLSSLDQPHEVDRTQSAWIHLFIPRDTFPDIGPAIDALRLKPLDTPMAGLLHDYLRLLAARLPQVTAAEAVHVAAATRAMLAAALAPSPDRQAEAAGASGETTVARVRRTIRENMHRATLGPDTLCRLVGVSRTQLYRLLEPFGGVAATIQAERLRAARAALGDPAERRSVARIAEDVGLFSPSSFSRMFRDTYGCTPSEMRQAALGGQVVRIAGPARPVPPAATLRQLLGGLGG